ncbi:succinate--CoA ligase subunit beta [Gilliamella sp. wkB292]|uniref:ADP-forming succinate--CoA ligase subunit beta n=1 Tax=Gilliamella sp. wkB292 TaxID=3120262 RepID=UPI00080E1814|nr:ADP-forming succinate--CoA ligase subunit beta [Gilliamella apicola]OCG13020.1 succinate--CoA ligase subunit beta [Gilliamella apicola]
MNLHEYQSKYLFKQYNLPVPEGYVCNSIDEVQDTLAKLASQADIQAWVAKCQVHAGGRGKAGGVICTHDFNEIKQFAEKWLGKHLVTYQTTSKGQPVNQILIEKASNIDKELYLGAVIDRSSKRVVIMASTEGGVDIESVAEKSPHLIHKISLDPLTGPCAYQGRELAFKLGLSGKLINQFAKLFVNLATLFLENDVSLAEVNPLVITDSQELICLDAKIVIDDNALFRHPNLNVLRDTTQEDERESIAAKQGISYVSLEGNIGCMVNGAGLAMATMDIIKLYGGEPANFLDVGGGTTKERVSEAFKLILSDKNVKAILVNIFGGIVRCDLIADGIISAIKEIGLAVPVVVRLEGNNAEIARDILAESQLNIITAKSLIDAAQKIVAVA